MTTEEFPKVYDDGAFTVDIVPTTGLFQSYDKDGNKLIYSSTEWECQYWSRRLLKAQQEGHWEEEEETRVVNSGFVGGKL